MGRGARLRGPLFDPCPLKAISGIWKFTREPRGRTHARSLPGHLLHLVTKGAYDLISNGRAYRIQHGDVIYYHESEHVEWLGNETVVAFCSVGFIAPTWPPLPLERRVFPASAPMKKCFQRLYAASLSAGSVERSLRAYGGLLELMDLIDRNIGRSISKDTVDSQWWEVEQAVRAKLLFRPTLEELTGLSGYSRASIVRACRRSTGCSPMRRIRQIRMEEARGLLLYSGLNVSQVAVYLGYPRLHEFSREFSNYFNHPPSKLLG